MKLLKTFLLLSIVTFSFTACAASFDCGKAATATEKMVCADEGLSKLDSELNTAYKAALEKVDIKDALKQDQKNWLNETRNVCKDVTCLTQAYQTRIDLLSQEKTESSVLADLEKEETTNPHNKNGHYIWKGDALNAIGDLVSKKEYQPLCRAFLKNLNSFKAPYPMVCELKLNAELGFRPLDWKPLNVADHESLVRQIRRYNSKLDEGSLKNINDDVQWKNMFETMKKVRHLEYAQIDVNKDGAIDNVIHAYSLHEKNKKCELDKTEKYNDQYYIADTELKNMINLFKGGEARALVFDSSGNFFTYQEKLYFVQGLSKRESYEKNPQTYTEFRLNEVPGSHDPMGYSERCFYWFIWP